ncbi:alpha/beta hydrolase [Bacillus salacetis]|uniref:Alpha/beta hydrolase n=1 Tax=Bacillus salacetis TaxID=2315464 RepID=A0A3A1QYT2_9BACI|nr:alpha/beta hydrolase [Bacillus salacetis]RIW32038.1 alpha/beta hydrolase [Bacillus salacetis]
MKHTSIYKSSEGKKHINRHYEGYVESLGIMIDRVYVDTSHGLTHVLAAGPLDGKPLFIFQGGNCINPMTLSWFTELAESYRIYAPDTIGHPGYSDENRISAKDHSFAEWIEELMYYFDVKRCAFIGPSYGGGIILRLAAFKPDKIACAVLVSPAGIKMGPKLKMIKDVLVPMVLFNRTASEKHLEKIADALSDSSLKKKDREIIGDIFKYVRLEQDMPKLTAKKELQHYTAPTLVIAGERDIFFPAKQLNPAVHEILPVSTIFKAYDMGHFPSQGHLLEINQEIKRFLHKNY